MRTLLLVTQYDGGGFSGWQRQPAARSVQGVMEAVLSRLADRPVIATAAGRTDAGVHAHGQGVSVRLPEAWTADRLQRAANKLLPPDVAISEVRDAVPNFHARRSALARRYRYLVALGPGARSPFRNRFEWAVSRPLDDTLLRDESRALRGEHTFRAFAVAHTAPIDDHHRCIVEHAEWTRRDEGWAFDVTANRFLHHMVRFLVGTMVDVAQGRRAPGTVARLLALAHNGETSAPAPAHGLSLMRVDYPRACFAVGREGIDA
jgi:tRNA pseudouridine38-40 synthase